ncbi:hypothetical protein AB1Y20_020951 [Prymnesium parvum]|uniref:Uncharacterized protein n=1 Tax=Prymnesium parvum TaxID=97485 RepID=A0AB34JK56_PRYPA
MGECAPSREHDRYLLCSSCLFFKCCVCFTASLFRTRSFPACSLLLLILNGRAASTILDFEAYVKPPNAGASDYFGYYVSLSGDTMAVGARTDSSCESTVSTTVATDNNCNHAGAVYVFTRSGTTWAFEAYVKAPNPTRGDLFGWATSLSGDALAVGSYREDSCTTAVSTTADTGDGCTDAGAAYVYTRSGTTWTFEAYVKAPNAGANDWFGYYVSLSGDTLAVGAFREDSCTTAVSTTADTGNGCTDAGAVYVFTRSGTTWTFEAYIKAPNAGVGDWFGFPVFLSGDTLAVGSPYEDSCEANVSTTAATDNLCTDAGAVYVFTRTGTTWTLEAYVKAPNASADSLFGDYVCVLDDTLAVGARHEDSCATTVSTTAATDSGCTNAGAAYVFTRTGTTWTFEAHLKAPNSEAGDAFGYPVALSGDILAVGAQYEDSCATTVSATAVTDNDCADAGAAYVFRRSGTTWTLEAYVKAPNAGAGDYYGYPVALYGNTLAVGAYLEASCTATVSTTAATDNGCASAGAAYVYIIPSLPPSPPAASISGDPHVRGGHGDSFDFKGQHNGIYVLLSTPALSISARFEHSSFFTPYSKLLVHGSWIKEVFWTVRTRRGQLLHADLSASSPSFNGSTARRTKIVDDVTFHFNNRALAVRTSQWFTCATVQKGKPHPGHVRISVTVRPLHNMKQSKVAPHGLLGQTYDDDNKPLHGKRDSYAVLDDGTRTEARRSAGGVVTTRAQGEGAIEGHAEMYRVRRPHDTEFAFTRFGRTTYVPARNVSLLRSLRHSLSSYTSELSNFISDVRR